MDVATSVQVPASVATVWRTLGDFAGLAAWHPAISAAHAEDGGRRRRVTLVDGSEVVEELIEHDDAGAHYSYRIVHAGPLPVQDYRATIAVADAGDGTCEVRWTARFEPVGNPTLAEQTIKRVYQTGLDNLPALFGGT